MRAAWHLLALASILALAAPSAKAKETRKKPAKQADKKPAAETKLPVQGYVSKGARSRFCFGVGVHAGMSITGSDPAVLGGGSVHFRMAGIAGLSLEIDFNRVTETPEPDDLSIEALHFIPDLRVAAVIYPYRWRMLAPFIQGGVGLDIRSGRVNLQFGLGLEVTFWKDRFAFLAEYRFFLPMPGDVEKHKERLEITGTSERPRTKDYYNFNNSLLTASFRFYY